jgi:hypothetical protein
MKGSTMGMRCPACDKKALSFQNFLSNHPLGKFDCNSCGIALKTGPGIRATIIVTLAVVFASLFLTFPVLDELVYSEPDQAIRFLIRMTLPYLIIVLQVILLFIPAAVYIWIWGRLEKAALPDDNPFKGAPL